MSLLYHFLDRPDACPAKKHIFVTGLSHQQNGLLDCDSLYVDNRLTHQQSPSHRLTRTCTERRYYNAYPLPATT